MIPTRSLPPATCAHLFRGPWLRGLLLGALAAVTLGGAASHGFAAPRAALSEPLDASRTAPTLRLIDGRLRGELHGTRLDAAVEQLAALVGARVSWSTPPGTHPAGVPIAGLTFEQALARLLEGRNYFVVLGEHPEIRVLTDDETPDLGEWGAQPPIAPALKPAQEFADMGRMAEIDRITHSDAEPAEIASDLDAIVRGHDGPVVRLAAMERLLDLDRDQAARALSWLASDAHPAVRRRAEALLETLR